MTSIRLIRIAPKTLSEQSIRTLTADLKRLRCTRITARWMVGRGISGLMEWHQRIDIIKSKILALKSLELGMVQSN